MTKTQQTSRDAAIVARITRPVYLPPFAASLGNGSYRTLPARVQS